MSQVPGYPRAFLLRLSAPAQLPSLPPSGNPISLRLTQICLFCNPPSPTRLGASRPTPFMCFRSGTAQPLVKTVSGLPRASPLASVRTEAQTLPEVKAKRPWH